MNLNFNIQLTPKQQEAYDLFHDEEVRELVLLFSRQSGKTVLAEIMMIEAALTKPNQTVYYISPTYSQGKKVYREISELLATTNLIKKRNSGALTIEFTNKSIIQFFTTKSPNAIRGNTCSALLVLDELAFFPELTPSGENTYHNVIYPITKARRPKIVHISTPAGKQGIFYEKYLSAIDESHKDIRMVKSTIYEDKFITPIDRDKLKASTPPLAWKQEFECEFLDSSLTALEGFEKCFVDGPCKIDKTKPVWMGLDFSTIGTDNTILTIIDAKGNVDEFRATGNLDRKYRVIAEVINQYPQLQCCYAESNSIGEVMINEIRKQLKKPSVFRPFTTTNSSKNEMIGLLQTCIAQRKLNIPKTLTEMYKEMGTFIYTVSKNKNITYAAKPPFHDDRVMALGFAVQAREDYKTFSFSKDTVFIRARNMSIR